MGVIATGSIFKTLTFDGRSSSEFNVYITGEGVFNAPERAVEMISIPGRNGAFALDNGRFENIEVTYNCGIAGDNDTDFAEAVSAFRNWLCSRNGYVRLTDDYNADEYRMAIYKSGLEVTAERLIAGEFPIVFECKPQRFLTSGEEKITVGEWGETTTETGDIVEIENPDGILSVKSLTADINAEQDLNGYSSPWIHDDNENTPYLFRSSDTVAEVGNSIFDTIVGGTLAVNQLVQNGNFADTSRWPLTNATNFSVTNNVGSFTATAQYGNITGSFTSVSGHKYYATAQVKISSGSAQVLFGGSSIAQKATTITGAFETISAVFDPAHTGTYSFPRVRDSRASGWDAIQVKNVMIFDLTAMFGSTIADYVYNLEQSTVGSGVAWLRQYYPSIFNSYQPYNAGTLESVEASEHRMTGFNQFDKNASGIQTNCCMTNTGTVGSGIAGSSVSDYIDIIGGQTYYFSQLVPNSVLRYCCWFNANKEFISSFQTLSVAGTKEAPTDARYIRLTYATSLLDTVCVNISSSRNGDYEPYTQTSYPLDSTLTLRGIPKLNNGVPYYDGDEYKSDGTVTRKYGEYTFTGSETWTWSATINAWITSGITGLKTTATTIRASNGLNCNCYVNGQLRVYSTYNPSITSSTDMNAMFPANSGLLFSIDETTETADPFTNPQVCYKGGTEEFVSSNVVPVGHVTDHANICPITGHDTVNVVVSPTTTGGTTYSTALGSTVYGGTLDIVSGELTVTHAMVDMGSLPWIASGDANNLFVASVSGKQNGNTNIMSDMYNVQAVALASMTHGGMRGYSTNNNVYCKNTDYSDAATFKTAMNGVQLVYELATPTTTTLTAQQVELLLGANNIWADTGNVTVEFGQNPNILFNPTLFESRPMLEVTGYGNVNLGSGTIEIHNELIGDVIVYNSTSWNNGSTKTIIIDTQYANNNDMLYVSNGPRFAADCLVEWSVPAGTITSSTITGSGDGDANITTLSNKTIRISADIFNSEFYFGTAATKTATGALSITTSNYGTLTGNISATLAYDGDSTFTLSRSVTKPAQLTSANPYTSIGDITLTSSQPTLGNPIYIDLNIGEAYKIENDVPVSVNNGVVIPAELPTLAPGANMVTCDNTITELDIVPRWWKI